MLKSTIALLIAALGLGAAHADVTLEPAKQIAAEVDSGVHPGFESFIMQVDGHIVGRAVESTLSKRPPDLRSATKSITALLIGIAIDQGAIPSVQTKVMDLLPARRRIFEQDPRKAAMTLEDLLTMRSGLDCNDWDPKSPGQEDKMYRQQDWVAFWSEQRMRVDPGKEFSYCTGNVVALGEILASAVSMSADAFALKIFVRTDRCAARRVAVLGQQARCRHRRSLAAGAGRPAQDRRGDAGAWHVQTNAHCFRSVDRRHDQERTSIPGMASAMDICGGSITPKIRICRRPNCGGRKATAARC